jgi:hypothetical protein
LFSISTAFSAEFSQSQVSHPVSLSIWRCPTQSQFISGHLFTASRGEGLVVASNAFSFPFSVHSQTGHPVSSLIRNKIEPEQESSSHEIGGHVTSVAVVVDFD